VLKKVTAYSGGYQCVLDMGASESDGALIFDITGIAEDSREITVDKLATRTVISAIAPKQRIIVLTIRITDSDAETRRRTLTNVFKSGNNVQLDFETDSVAMGSINGVAESCNTPVFVKESTMTVTIICPQSVFTGTLVTHMFGGSELFTNPGDTSCGCTATIQFASAAATGTVSLLNSVNGTSMNMSIEKIVALVGNVQADDIIIIETDTRKSCKLKRGSTYHNIFSTVAIPYSWIQIDPGDNNVTVTGPGSVIATTRSRLTYKPSYGGL
jgi:hypothetical protein